MTSSNQVFKISGDRDELLKEVLKLIDFMEETPLNPTRKPIKGMIIKDDCLEFLWVTDVSEYSSIHKEDISKLVPIDVIDTFPTIKNWLASNHYQQAVQKLYGGDGGSKKGWQIELGKESSSECGYKFYVTFRVRPFYTYYSK